MSTLVVFSGKVTSILFSNVSNSFSPFSIFEVEIMENSLFIDTSTIIVKVDAEIPEKGIIYKFYGELDRDTRGMFFKCTAYIREIPINVTGVIDFLASGLFYGIGRKKAEKIVQELGEDCLIQIMNDSSVLTKVKGIQKKTIETISELLLENLGMQALIMKLHHFRISLTLAKKIYKRYGLSSVKMIEDNPYCLANNIRGVSFTKADEVATELKIVGADPKRIKGAIEYVLHMIYEEDGSTYAVRDYVVFKVQQLLFQEDGIEYSKTDINAHLDDLVFTDIRDRSDFHTDIGQVRQVNNRIYLARYYRYEERIAETLMTLFFNKEEKEDLDGLVDIYLLVTTSKQSKQFTHKLSEEQEMAVFQSLRNRVSIITGGPGTGKSTVILMILMVYIRKYDFLPDEELLDKIILLAPTGRAAKRMTEITQLKASTIHSFLERREEKKQGNRLFIIDESSMLDITIMNKFVEFLSKNDHIIFIGDDEQLPPINAGNFFKDIINSEVFPTVNLKEVFRQKESSGILKLASTIRSNEQLDKRLVGLEDLNWLKVQSKDVLASINREICRLIHLGETLNEIQVITSKNSGGEGVININLFIQEQLLAGLIERDFEMVDTGFFNSTYRFYTGDRVISLANNMMKSIVNGSIGIIEGVLSSESYLEAVPEEERAAEEIDYDQVIVNYDGNKVLYRKEELNELALAYCFTVHKSQGSEFKNVILVIPRTNLELTNKNLLYTAVTRASKNLCIVGDIEFFQQGLKIAPKKRFTFLKDMLNRRAHTSSIS